MGYVVAFDYPTWIARYPEFTSTVNAATALDYFTEATLYLANDGTSPASSSAIQLMLLNMLTAHLAMLYSGTATDPATSVVGRVSSANEGSVSVSLTMDLPAGTAQWFGQTKYGISFWAATAAYRTFRYRRGPTHPVNPFLYTR